MTQRATPLAICYGTGEWLCYACAQAYYTPQGLTDILNRTDNSGRAFIKGEGFIRRMDRAPQQPQRCYSCYCDIE